jgi:hypothetical protein
LVSSAFQAQNSFEDLAFLSISVSEMAFPGGIDFLSGSAVEADTLDSLSFVPPAARFDVVGSLFRDISGHGLFHFFGRAREFHLLSSAEESFESNSTLSRIDPSPFSRNGLTSIHRFIFLRRLKRFTPWAISQFHSLL